MIRRVVAAVFVAGLVLTGCSSTPESAPPPTPEQLACQGWATAFNAESQAKDKTETGYVMAQAKAATTGRSGPAVTLMNVAIVKGSLGENVRQEVLDIQSRCADVGVVFDYPA